MVDVSSFMVTWESNNNGAEYTVIAQGENGLWNCSSVGTSCTLGKLPCGSMHMVHVLASTSEGTSLPSYSVPLETGNSFCSEILQVQ